MKRFYYIISAVLLLLAASCTDELIDDIVTDSHEEKVPIIMSFADEVTLHATTKATSGMEMGINPAIKTIHVAVFGSSGYLKDYASAVPCDSEGRLVSGFVTNNATTGYFKVYLPFDEAPSRRRIHIIANGPESLPFNAYEDEIIGNMAVNDGNGAYWTRFETDPSQGEGILIKTTDTGSEIHRVIDGNGDYVPTDETKALFQGLKLIRNFAAIEVVKNENAPNNFAIDGFTVCNMPSEGRVAIYNETSSEWIPGSIRGVDNSGYASLSLDNDTALLTYNSTIYPGFPAYPMINTYVPQTPAAFDAVGASSQSGSAIFIYERAKTKNTPPFVLIKARWVASGDVADDSPTYYYRLDIMPNDTYVPFYRNFKYTVKISGINIAGYDTPGEASKRNSGDNFSVSLETQTIPSVSNGTTMIHVQQTDIAELYDPDNNTKDLWYQFELLGVGFFNGTTGSPSGGTTTVEIREIERGALASWSVAGSDDGESKRHITYSLNNPTTKDLTSVLRITGTYTPAGAAPIKITRDITITALKPKTLSVYLSPDRVGPEAGDQTMLNINLPDDLPRGVFPLDFAIEDSDLGLNARDKDVAVIPGKSIIPGSTANTYQFHKTLNWSDYLDMVEDATLSGAPNPVLSVPMKTTKDNSPTTVYVSNSYFNTANATLTRDSGNYLSPGSQNADYNSHSDIVFNVISSGAWNISIGLENGTSVTGASVSPSYGSSETPAAGTPVTVTIPANPGKNTRTYVLTMTNTADGVTRMAYIVQGGRKFQLSADRNSVKGDGTPATLTLVSESDSWTVTAPEGCTLTHTGTSGTGTRTLTRASGGSGTFTIVLNMPKNNSLDEEKINTVTAAGPAGTSLSSSVSISQTKAMSTNGSVEFNTGTALGGGLFENSLTATRGNVTATFSDIAERAYFILISARDYTGISSGTTLTINTAAVPDRIELTGLSLSFTGNNYSSTSVTTTSVTATPQSGGATNWTGSDTAESTVFTLTRSNTGNMRLESFTVNYTYRTWPEP